MLWEVPMLSMAICFHFCFLGPYQGIPCSARSLIGSDSDTLTNHIFEDGVIDKLRCGVGLRVVVQGLLGSGSHSSANQDIVARGSGLRGFRKFFRKLLEASWFGASSS